jgi:GNAT superfamily N-acetyltransferase
MTAVVKGLADSSDAELCIAWKRAFVDYGMNVTDDQLLAIFKRRGYNLDISFGGFSDGQMISLTLNAIGMFNGLFTAYDVCTGTSPEFRRQGIATEVFNSVVPVLKHMHAEQYILEVLNHNEAAKALYLKMGFTIAREFCFFRQPVTEVKTHLSRTTSMNTNYASILELTEFPPNDELSRMWDCHPSWQNSHDSVHSKFTLYLLQFFQYV